MEQTCKWCNRIIDSNENMRFCPYCGRTEQGVCHSDYQSVDISWKLESIFGNQAKYADKTMELCRNITVHVCAWASDQNNLVLEQKPDHFVTVSQLQDDFEFLRTASGMEELEHEFKSFMRNLIAVCTGNKTLRSARMEYVDLGAYIREKLQFFEVISGLSTHFEYHFDENRNDSIYTGFENLEEILDTLNQAFESLKKIVKSQGYLCVQNCNFNASSIRLLKKYISENPGGTLCYDLRGIVFELSNSSKQDYSDLFNEQYESHIVMFFEGLWIVMESMLSQFQSLDKNTDVFSVQDYVDEWLSCVEIAIDRAKYDPFTDMMKVYLSSRRACSAVIDTLI